MNLNDCHNFSDFRKLAKKKLPSKVLVINNEFKRLSQF